MRRARITLGWSRAELAHRLPETIHHRTLATYEQGTRHCTVNRFVEICHTLGVAAPTILDNALRHAALDQRTRTLQVDLAAIADDERPELASLRQWAAKRRTTNPDQPTAQLHSATISEMAILLNYPPYQLWHYLTKFATTDTTNEPSQSAPRTPQTAEHD